MKISRHIHYFQNPDSCYRFVLTFDPPLDVESTLGKVDSMYSDVNFMEEGKSNKLLRTANVINKNGLLHITEVMKPGEILSIELRSGYRLDKMRIGEEQELQLYAGETGLLYHLTIGKHGAIDVSAMVVEDKENSLAKLRVDLTDTAMRAYLVQRTLADAKVTLEGIDKPPDIMNHKEAANYLRISERTLYRKVQDGEIRRTRNKKYRKEELDYYLNDKNLHP